MVDNSATEGSTLIWIKMVTSQLMMSHSTNCVNEVPTVEVFKPVLIWVVSVGATIELQRGRVLNPILVMGIL